MTSEPITVLIAEDDASLRTALTELLLDEGDMSVVGAAVDADEAIALARIHQPSVAILDVRMPGGGGPHAAREIRSACAHTGIVALSAYEDAATIRLMRSAGALAYIVKGTDPQVLVTTVRRCAGSSHPLEPTA